jgi:hypothetical protein
MKRLIAICLAAALACGLAGCDAVQKKFTRKKKTVKAPRIIQEQKYDIKPTPELYEKHFSYWRSWSSEMIQRLGDNHKKDMRCIEEILGQLADMRRLLVPEAGDKLVKHIRRYEEIRDTINTDKLDRSNSGTVLGTLEREDRIIGSEFAISRVKDYIRKSFDDAPAATGGG